MNTCQLCQHPGAVAQVEYLGGHGYVTRYYCQSRLACWARYDASH